MRYIDIIILSLRIFRVHQLRTILTIFAISVGVAVIVFLVSLGYGLQAVTVEKIANIEAFLALDVTTARPDLLPLDDTALEKFSQVDHVSQVVPLVGVSSQMVIGNRRADVSLNGTDGSFFALDGLNFSQGSSFSSTDRAKIVVSKAAIKLLGIAEGVSPLGQEIELVIFDNKGSAANPQKVPYRFTIVGVFNDEASAQGFIPVKELKELIGRPLKYDLVKVKVQSRAQVEPTKMIIAAMGYSASSVIETIDDVAKIFRYLRAILGGFGLIALIVSAIGMFNTMTISLLERIREIGVMRSLGASDRDIWLLFLTEAWIIGLIGGLSGVIIGVASSRLANIMFNIFAKTLGGEPQEVFSFPILFVVGMLLFAQAVALATGFYPSYRAVKVNPLDALRYE